MPLDKLFYSREIVQAMSKYTHTKRPTRQGKSTKYAPAEAAKTQPRFEQPKSDKNTNKKMCNRTFQRWGENANRPKREITKTTTRATYTIRGKCPNVAIDLNLFSWFIRASALAK